MAPTNKVQTSYQESNKTHKEERKKWREKNLMKKLEKQKLKDLAKVQEQSNRTEHSQYDNLSTLSIAVPGSILENAQSPELRTYLAGQVARAACMFQADEVVVFDDYANAGNGRKSEIEDSEGVKVARQSCVQLGRILQYLECPQYLRKHFFPIHKDLKFAGILNPLDAPHHLRMHNSFMFREGVVTNKPIKSGHGSLVNVGLLKDIHVDKLLTPGLRCTVKLDLVKDGQKRMKGTVVPPSTPRKQTGIYWGYNVRLANSLSQVFSQSPFKEGYDLTIGTSDKGESIDSFCCPKYNHVLIMFGGLEGIDAALENDENLKVDEASDLFDVYLNALPAQGSRTLRTEEAIMVTLAALRSKLNPNCRPMEFTQVDAIAQSSENRDVGAAKSEQLEKINAAEDLSRFE